MSMQLDLVEILVKQRREYCSSPVLAIADHLAMCFRTWLHSQIRTARTLVGFCGCHTG